MHSIFYKYICKYGVSCIILAKILREFEISFHEIYIYIYTYSVRVSSIIVQL